MENYNKNTDNIEPEEMFGGGVNKKVLKKKSKNKLEKSALDNPQIN